MARLTLAALFVAALALPASAGAAPKLHECQHPVVTGVEVYHLRHVKPATACPVALKLFSWENATPAHARKLYGCHRPAPGQAGYPYLKKHHFDGYKLSLSNGAFTMTRGKRSFRVGGTDFPLNCT
jgi:hypothetical protein